MPTPDAFPLSAAGAGVVTAHVAVRSPSRATSTHAAIGMPGQALDAPGRLDCRYTATAGPGGDRRRREAISTATSRA